MTHPSSARTVRKRLDDDCLLEGELHPNIAERLNRVRELPVRAVANLLGVEKDSQGFWMVWQYVEGQTLEEFLANEHSREDIERVFRELRLALSAMHSHGIVHGAIHGRNVIIDPTGRVRLTHVSPLLYDDPRLDSQAVEKLAAVVSDGTTIGGKTAENLDEFDALRIRAYIAAAVSLLCGILIFAGIFWYIRG